VIHAASLPAEVEVHSAFDMYESEPAHADVLFVKAASSLRFDGATALATFGPSSIAVVKGLSLAGNLFGNVAASMGTPVAFLHARGLDRRQRVSTINLTLRSGRDLHSVSVNSIYRAGNGPG
jgi:hypothetical protein